MLEHEGIGLHCSLQRKISRHEPACKRVYTPDHFPYFGLRGKEDAQRLTESFAKTRDLYVEVFGFDPYAKAGPTECDSCSCNSCSSCQSGCGCTGGGDGEFVPSGNTRPTVDFHV